MMEIAEAVDREIDPVYYEFDDTQVALNAGRFYVLTNTTEGDAADIVDGVEEGWGLEAWRLMTKPFRQKTVGHNRKRLMKVLEGKYEGNFSKRTLAFERAVKEYKKLSNKTIDKEKTSIGWMS